MPRKCCVPNCRGNYAGSKVVSIFKFPADESKRRLWLNKISRADFEPSSHSVVCEAHFVDSFIIRKDSVRRPDGSILTVDRDRPKLADDAYPSIFPGCPSYMSDEPPAKRKKPDDRFQEAMEKDNVAFKEWMRQDQISNFADFSGRLKSHLPSGAKWLLRSHESYHTLYRIIDENASATPVLSRAIKVLESMQVEIYTAASNGTLVRVPDSSPKWLFTDKPSPVLTCWTQFSSVLSHYTNAHCDRDKNVLYKAHVSALQDLCSKSDENSEPGEMHSSSEHDAEEKDVAALKTRKLFLIEQLKLLSSATKRYTSDTVLWAFQVLASSSKAYSFLRDSVLTLPHPSYLKRLASVFNVDTDLQHSSLHEEYLRKKCEALSERERLLILMLDEIHVAHTLSYKGGRVEGHAETTATASESNTAQVFMISSLMSKAKDVMGIVGVKQLTGDMLRDLLYRVLFLLHHVGFTVICIISDNNRINRNAFVSMCGGTLRSSIPNIRRPGENIFFLFDTVHIFKCVRNNWLNQKDQEKTLELPAFDCNDDRTLRASFHHLRKLYSSEESSVVRLAPALNQKSLYPTNTEKQSVSLMLRVFDSRNVVALDHFEKIWNVDTKGTRIFIQRMIKLWNILNVKHPGKHIRLRNEDCRPISFGAADQSNVEYLRDVIAWLGRWKNMQQKAREGCFSSDTMTALTHTLSTLIDLSRYLTEVKGFKYILLGKFQTDNLEFRFSQYHNLSGSNYHVSVQQLIEGEKKLKLISALKLVSASNGTLSLKDFTAPLGEKRELVKCAANATDHVQFLEHLDEGLGESNPSDEQLRALIFISGYAVSKVLPKLDCEACKQFLSVDKTLQVEATEDCYTYLCALDRGGLTFPTDVAVTHITQVFSIFQFLVGTKEQEQKFLQCRNQRQVMLRLVDKKLSNCDATCDTCGDAKSDLLRKCSKPAINIFLNNYTKKFCDKPTAKPNARKLKAFHKD